MISLQPALDADPLLAGKVAIADNGGADLLYWTGAAGTASRGGGTGCGRSPPATPGVLPPTTGARTSLRLGPEAGDVVAFCKAGWRFSEPDPSGNPIPGNHGHPPPGRSRSSSPAAHPDVAAARASSAPARTVDVAPTVARLFGCGRAGAGTTAATGSGPN